MDKDSRLLSIIADCGDRVCFDYGNLLKYIPRIYSEPWRFYHNSDHISSMLERYLKDEENLDFTPIEKQALFYAILYHDAFYKPWEIEKGESHFIDESITIFTSQNILLDDEVKDLTNQIIYFSADHNVETVSFNKDLANYFTTLDLLLYKTDNYIDVEKKIFKEYQFIDWSVYKKERIKVLKKYRPLIWDHCKTDVTLNIKFIENWQPNIGIFAGSFNPFHKGHLYVYKQSSKLFDKVIIAIGQNSEKTNDKYSRTYDLQKEYPWLCIEKFVGLYSDYFKGKNDANYYTIKGLRNGYDLDYEINQRTFIAELSNTPTNEDYFNFYYIITPSSLSHISSSAIRNITNKISGVTGNKYLPTINDFN